MTDHDAAKLNYTMPTSLDGYIKDDPSWAEPDAEVHAFINDLTRGVGTFLLGRRMYETMAVWQKVGIEPVGPWSEEPPPEVLDFAEVWRAADKVVYSRTLDSVSTPRTRLEREFDPEAIQRMKSIADSDLSISGPGLAQHAFAAGLVDEVNLIVFPVVLGGGKPVLPQGVWVDLELLDERRFSSSVVHLRYGKR